MLFFARAATEMKGRKVHILAWGNGNIRNQMAILFDFEVFEVFEVFVLFHAMKKVWSLSKFIEIMFIDASSHL